MGAAALPLAMGAMGMMGGAMSSKDGGGGSGSVGYIQSPQQQQMWQLQKPLMEATANYGLGNIQYIGGTPIYPSQPTPQPTQMGGNWYQNSITGETQWMRPNDTAFTMGSNMWGPFGNQVTMGGPAPTTNYSPQVGTNIENLWPIPSYDIPSAESLMPSANMLNSISPSVMAGILQPYQLAESQLMETLGGGGQLGSARAGFSGAGAAGLGKFWGQAAPTIGQQAWSMIQPGLQADYASQLQRAQSMWGEQLQQYKYPWQAGPSYISMSMPTPYVQQPGESPLSGLGSLLGGIGSLYGSTGGTTAAGK